MHATTVSVRGIPVVCVFALTLLLAACGGGNGGGGGSAVTNPAPLNGSWEGLVLINGLTHGLTVHARNDVIYLRDDPGSPSFYSAYIATGKNGGQLKAFGLNYAMPEYNGPAHTIPTSNLTARMHTTDSAKGPGTVSATFSVNNVNQLVGTFSSASIVLNKTDDMVLNDTVGNFRHSFSYYTRYDSSGFPVAYQNYIIDLLNSGGTPQIEVTTHDDGFSIQPYTATYFYSGVSFDFSSGACNATIVDTGDTFTGPCFKSGGLFLFVSNSSMLYRLYQFF